MVALTKVGGETAIGDTAPPGSVRRWERRLHVSESIVSRAKSVALVKAARVGDSLVASAVIDDDLRQCTCGSSSWNAMPANPDRRAWA